MRSPEPPPRPPAPDPRTEVLVDAPPPGPWWQRQWGAAAIGVLGLLVGLALGAAVGGSVKTNPATETQAANAQTVTNTVSNTATVNHTKFVVHTHTVTAPAQAQSAPSESAGGNSAAEQSYHGNGGKNLGTITVTKESNLEWTNDGNFFAVMTSEGVPVNSQAHSGSSVLEAGTYSKFEVNAIGSWTIRITPK
jgi:hypothetical protein